MTTTITVCETCRRRDGSVSDTDKRDGEIFCEMVEAAATGVEGVKVSRFQCLAGCDEACNVALQSPQKFSYALGRFEPSVEKANALVEFAALHDQSADGMVPFRDRPEGIKGHMRVKLPILD